MRFSYVKYDTQATAQQAKFKQAFENLEIMIDSLAAGRSKSLVLTKLEEAYMWIGKSIRDDQIERLGSDDEPSRSDI